MPIFRKKESIPQPQASSVKTAEGIFSPDLQQQLEQIKHRLEEMKDKFENKEEWNKLTLTEMQNFKAELDELKKQRNRIERGTTAETTITATNKETNKEIEINLETERQRWQTFYESHNFKNKVEIPELSLTEEQIKEVQTLIEQGFVDKVAIIPDHLTYQELEPEMAKGYVETYQGSNFQEDKGFQELDKLEQVKQPTYRLIFYKKTQGLDSDKKLKETKGKSPDKMDEELKQINKQYSTDIQGISLKDYLIIQREFVETTNTDKDIQDKSRHMESGSSDVTWCLKSKFKKSGRVVIASWNPDIHRLYVDASDASDSSSNVGSRLSRSFEVK